MKLFWSEASPFARKVLAAAIEKGLDGRIEVIPVNTREDPAGLIAANPLGKIPAMLLDDGMALYDSPVICAYLDAHPDAAGGPLIPASGPERWLVLRGEAFGDGMMDLGVALIGEKRKPDGEKSPTMAARQRTQLERSLDAAPAIIEGLPDAFTLGHLAIACTLDYLDFRHPEIDWRQGRGALAEWGARIAERPSLARTMPK